MPDAWRKIERGLFESPNGRWRITNPWKVTTELRHRWLVAERDSSGSGWCMHHDRGAMRERDEFNFSVGLQFGEAPVAQVRAALARLTREQDARKQTVAHAAS